MKIVFTDTTLSGKLIGGAQTFLPRLVKGLVQRGHEVYIAADGPPNIKVSKEIGESGAVYYIHEPKNWLLPEEKARLLAEWVNKLQADMYVVSVSPDIGWLTLPYLYTGIASFSIGHTDAPTFYDPARHYRPLLTTVVGVSDMVCEHYIEKDGFDPADVIWIPYGVETRKNPPVADPGEIIKLIYVGRLDEGQKRVADLAAVIQQLSEKEIPYHLQVVGDGAEMSSFCEKLKTQIEKGEVEMTGWLSPVEVQQRLQESEVFLLTSAYEGFCIALTEAMANGCCPVVTDIRSGNKQLITKGKNGYMLPVGDITGFTETIAQLQEAKALLTEKRNAAWQSGQNYDVERMVLSYEKAFIEAREKVRRKPRKYSPEFPVMESCRSPYPHWIRKLKNRFTAK